MDRPNLGTAMAETAAWPRPAVAWYAVALLLLAAMLSFVDRQILSLLVAPIRRDLAITDVQMSLLQGFAFAIFFAIAGLPFGYLADRRSRRLIIAAGVAFWSLMTAACGLAHSYGHLFLARMGVGLGEAALGPAAWSLLSDLFPKQRLPLAFGVYMVGTSIGAGLAFAVGGTIADLASGPAVTLPVIGEMYAWQFSFFIVGLPGLLLAAAMLTLREPVRRGVTAQTASLSDSLRRVATFLKAHRRLAWTYLIGIAALTAVGYCGLAWTPSFLARRFGWSAADAGRVLGILIVTCGTAGAIGGGALAVWLRRRGFADAPLRAAVIIAALLLPVGIVMPLLPTSSWVVAGLAVHTLLASSFVALGPSAIQTVTPNELRGQVSAVALMLTSLIGMTTGPLLAAALTTYVFGDDMALGKALSITFGAGAALATVALAASLRPLSRATAEALGASGE